MIHLDKLGIEGTRLSPEILLQRAQLVERRAFQWLQVRD